MPKLKELRKLAKQIQSQRVFFNTVIGRTKSTVEQFEKLFRTLNGAHSKLDLDIELYSLYSEISGYHTCSYNEKLAAGNNWPELKNPFLEFSRESVGLYCDLVNDYPSEQNIKSLKRLREKQTRLEGEDRFRLL